MALAQSPCGVPMFVTISSPRSFPHLTCMLMSRSSRFISKLDDAIAFSGSILKVKTCSNVLRPDLLAACVMGILLFSLSDVRLIIMTARIFRSLESKMMGLRFVVVLFFPLVWVREPICPV